MGGDPERGEDAHVAHHAEEVASEAELRAEMDAALVAPLDVEKPLWDVTVLTLKQGAAWTPSKGGPVAPPPWCASAYRTRWATVCPW